MPIGLGRTVVLAGLAAAVLFTNMADAADGAAKPAFRFRDVGYFARWSQNDQHEFTPDKQEDLKTWTDMVTLNGYRDVREGEALAAKANAVLENYKRAGAIVLRTDSVPAKGDRPAEHLIAVVFGRPTFIEAAFARFRLVDGQGCSAVYSHRIHGEKKGDDMSTWLRSNGPAIEKALMEANSLPSPHLLSTEQARTKI